MVPKPPLCKGRWIFAQQKDGGIVMDDVLSKRRPADGDNPPVTATAVTAPFTQRGHAPTIGYR